MDTARIITGTILGLISLLCLVYVSFTARGKGFIFSNSNIFIPTINFGGDFAKKDIVFYKMGR